MNQRVTRLELVFFTVVLAAFAFLGFRRNVEADENNLRVRSLEIIDSKGVARLRIGAPVPDPSTDGKTSARRSPLNGIQINDAFGNELGGLGMMDDGSMMFCFDSKTSEATCMFSMPSGERGFSVTDDKGKDRALMEISSDKSVSLSIHDDNQKPRALVRFVAGAAEIQIKTPDGRTLWAAPLK